MPSKVVADNILIFYSFSKKIRCVIPYELSARQTIHMKCQALFSQKMIKNIRYIEMLSAAFRIGTLRVNDS